MSDLTTAWSALPRSLRQRDVGQPAGSLGFTRKIARLMSWIWVQWRRREIIRTLNRVADPLLLDPCNERGNIEEIVDALIARWR